MFKTLKKIFSLLTKDQRKRFYILQILVILMVFFEMIGIASIIPFMTIVGDISMLKKNTFVATMYQLSGAPSEITFLFILGLIVLFMLLVSALLSMITVWKLSIFGNKVGVEIADRLYGFYLKKNWLFHSSGSSAKLIKKISVETSRLTGGILIPFLQINSRILFTLFSLIAIFIYDPFVSTIGLTIFATTYFIVYRLVRVRLKKNGLAISEMSEKRFRLMNEGFGGIQDILLTGRDSDLIKRFNDTGHIFSYSLGVNNALAQLPRYLVELIAFGSMILLVLYLIFSHNSNLALVLPVISVYALTGFKLLPAFQQIYVGLASIKSNVAAFDSIQNDLYESKNNSEAKNYKPIKKELKLKKNIQLENVSFTYPDKKNSVIKNINLSISANSTVGIVGPSGSGKSTLVDILIGLIDLQHGYLKIDGLSINKKNCRQWQNTIGFVPQNIFLSEGTISENIAFGVQKEKIDLERVKEVIKLVHLNEFVNNLEQGINTKTGERGMQISGGQRQRIGIARALYRNASVLVFDEATSSLDGVTEKSIMQAINDFSGKKTIIIIAHRLKTIEKCNNIFFMKDGKIIDQGTFDELINKNYEFKNISRNT